MNDLRITLGLFTELIALIFDIVYIYLARIFKGMWGWNGVITGLIALFQALVKVLVYYLETVIIGLAIKLVLENGPVETCDNSSIMNTGFNLLAICFFPLLFLIWMNLIIKELMDIYKTNIKEKETIRQINVFSTFQNTIINYKVLVNILWLPSLCTVIPLLAFLGYIPGLAIGITIYFIILGIWQMVSDYQDTPGGKTFHFWRYIKEIGNFKDNKNYSKIQKSLGIISSGIALYFVFELLINFKMHFLDSNYSLKNIYIYPIFILMFAFMSFLLIKTKKYMQVALWCFVMFTEAFCSGLMIWLCFVNKRLIGNFSYGVVMILSLIFLINVVWNLCSWRK